MSDSDSVPGEVEYSDDEDYIRNESVMSARYTKIGLESVAQEQKSHLPTETQTQIEVERSEQEHVEQQRKEPVIRQIAVAQENINIQSMTKHSEEAQKRQELTDLIEKIEETAHLQQSYAIASENQRIQERRQQELKQKLQQKGEQERNQEGNSESSNDDEQVYRDTYFSEEPAVKQEKKSQLQMTQSKLEQQITNVKNPQYQSEVETVAKAQTKQQKPQITVSLEESQKRQIQKIIIQSELPKQQAQHASEVFKSQIEQKAQAVNRQMPSQQYTQSEQQLLANMNIVAASSNSEFTENGVERKLFKTDLQKSENISNQQSSQYVAVERASQLKPNSSIQQLLTMSPQQSRPSPKYELGTIRKQEVLQNKSEACKCMIM